MKRKEENRMKSDAVRKGIDRAPHRSLFKAMGYTDKELRRPLVGIANSANEIIPGHIHLDKLVEAVKAGVYMAGGVPIEFGGIGVCDGIAMNHEGMKYSLASRELIADSVEVMAKAHAFDALVLVPNCDKIIPGMLMAAARLDIPSIIVSGGPMLAGRHPSKPEQKIDLITVFEAVGAVHSGKMSEQELCLFEDEACPTCGSCAGMFTANSMNCLTEALGMALPGNGTILANAPERRTLVSQAAARLVAPGPADFYIEPTTGMVLVAIRPGVFMMGTPESEPGRNSDEVLHRVNLPRLFYIGQHEVTQAEWTKVMGSNPSHFDGCERCPVESVDFYQVNAFLFQPARQFDRVLNRPAAFCPVCA